MVAVFLICWSPYASLAVATLLGYAQVGRFTGECHGTIFYHLTASTHSKMFNKMKENFASKWEKLLFYLVIWGKTISEFLFIFWFVNFS